MPPCISAPPLGGLGVRGLPSSIVVPCAAAVEYLQSHAHVFVEGLPPSGYACMGRRTSEASISSTVSGVSEALPLSTVTSREHTLAPTPPTAGRQAGTEVGAEFLARARHLGLKLG